MTTPLPGAGTPAPQPPRQDRPTLHWPEPSTRRGAVLYAIIGGLIAWMLIYVVTHIHVAIAWH